MTAQRPEFSFGPFPVWETCLAYCAHRWSRRIMGLLAGLLRVIALVGAGRRSILPVRPSEDLVRALSTALPEVGYRRAISVLRPIVSLFFFLGLLPVVLAGAKVAGRLVAAGSQGMEGVVALLLVLGWVVLALVTDQTLARRQYPRMSTMLGGSTS